MFEDKTEEAFQIVVINLLGMLLLDASIKPDGPALWLAVPGAMACLASTALLMKLLYEEWVSTDVDEIEGGSLGGERGQFSPVLPRGWTLLLIAVILLTLASVVVAHV